MARIIIDGKAMELGEGEPIKVACEMLGVPFGCEAGTCGTCVIVVESGLENLQPRNAMELDMRLRGNERLACQARIGTGEVTATW
jgi:ferredoxin